MKNIIKIILNYKLAYSNWLMVLLAVILKREIKAKLQNCDVVPTRFLAMQVKDLVIHGMQPKYNAVRDELIFNYDGKLVIMKGASLNGDISGVFVREDYKYLDVAGKFVIDVGMNIADSSIYFALNGASKVMAYEPFKKVFKIATENINSNMLSEKVFPVNAGIGSEDSIIRLADLTKITDREIKDSENGIEIPVYSLNTIIEECQSSEIMLKMDCEGCEYDVFQKVKKENLSKIKKIMLEYHHGCESLTTVLGILKQNSFKCTISKPHKSKVSENFIQKVGFLYAERQE